MSTKTIAVDSRVYARLAAAKLESESFSKAIDRILGQAGSKGTGEEILRGLGDLSELSYDDGEQILKRVAESREEEGWEKHDLS